MDPGSISTILAAPGQLVKAAVNLKKLYDAFFDEHRNATTEAREFAQLVSTFAINLINQERLIARAGKFFPGEENFLKTIDQCEKYLRKYDNLLAETKSPVRKVYETTRWAADLANERRALVDKLNIHVNSMNSYSMNVLLEIALRDREGIRAYPEGASEPVAVEEDKTLQKFHSLYNQLYNSIVILQSRQKRDKKYQQMPDLVMTDLEKIIKQWQEILIESGMQKDRLPDIPGPGTSKEHTIDQAMYEWRRDVFRELKIGEEYSRSRSPSASSRASSEKSETPRSIAPTPAMPSPNRRPSLASPRASFPEPSPRFDHPGLHSPLDGAENSAHPSPASTFGQPQVFSPAGTIYTNSTAPSLGDRGSIASSFGSLSLYGDPIGEPIGELKWERHTVKLFSYEIDERKRPRTIIWNRGRKEVEHLIGKQPHPYTQTATFNHPLRVSFIEDHDIRYHNKAYKCHPVYEFFDESHVNPFQSAAEGRQLLEVFSVEQILSATSTRQGEAADQHVKIWKSNESDRHYLTFYANAHSPPKHRRLLVSWFERPTVSDKPKPCSVKLLLKQRPRAPSGPSRRRSGFSILSLSPRNRNDSVSSVTSVDRPSILDTDDPLPTEEQMKLEYLEVLFANPEQREEFVTAFQKALDGTLASAVAQRTSSRSAEDTATGGARTQLFGAGYSFQSDSQPRSRGSVISAYAPDQRSRRTSGTTGYNELGIQAPDAIDETAEGEQIERQAFAAMRATPATLLRMRPPV